MGGESTWSLILEDTEPQDDRTAPQKRHSSGKAASPEAEPGGHRAAPCAQGARGPAGQGPAGAPGGPLRAGGPAATAGRGPSAAPAQGVARDRPAGGGGAEAAGGATLPAGGPQARGRPSGEACSRADARAARPAPAPAPERRGLLPRRRPSGEACSRAGAGRRRLLGRTLPPRGVRAWRRPTLPAAALSEYAGARAPPRAARTRPPAATAWEGSRRRPARHVRLHFGLSEGEPMLRLGEASRAASGTAFPEDAARRSSVSSDSGGLECCFSVLESKVRALKAKVTSSEQVVSLPSGEQSSPRRPKCRRAKSGDVRVSEDSALLGAAIISHVHQEEPARNGGSGPPSPPGPQPMCWNGQSPWPPQEVGVLPDHERCPPPGPSSLPQTLIRRITTGWPAGRGPCKITHMPSLEKGGLDPPQDGLVIGRGLENEPLISERDFFPSTALLGGFWRSGDWGAQGTGGNALSLSDQVERNRLMLQEMLKVSGHSFSKEEPSAWTPSWNRAAPEPPAGDLDWDSGISLQDSDQNRIFAPKPEAALSARHEKAKLQLQRARMKARTQPLRASHDIVPAVAQGSRDGQRSPALGPRTVFACKDSLQSRSLNDSSDGETSSGQLPKQGISPSHVRFEDESACEAEFRYLERLQQRQRQVLSTALEAMGQGLLCSKPDLSDYVNSEVGIGAFHRPRGGLDCTDVPDPPPTWGSEKCQACGNCPDGQHLAEGKAPPNPSVLQEFQAACGKEGVLLESYDSQGLSSPFWHLPSEPGVHVEWIRETHIGETFALTTGPEERCCALDSIDASDSCQPDSEEAKTTHPSRVGEQTKGNCPQQGDSRPQRGHRWSQKAEIEPPWGPQASHHPPRVDDMEAGEELKEGVRFTPKGIQFLREDAVPKPSAGEPERASLESQKQPGRGMGSHQTSPVDAQTSCSMASATTSSMKLAPSGPGGPAQVGQSHESLQIACTSSLTQNHAESSNPHPAQSPSISLSPEGWVPAPPSSKRITSPVPHRRAFLAGLRRPRNQGEPVDISLPLSSPRPGALRTCGLSLPQTRPGSPQLKHPLLVLSVNKCNSCIPQGPQGAAVHKGRVEGSPCSQEPELPRESGGDGLWHSLGYADTATINSTGITVSLALEEPESSQEPERSPQRTEFSSGGHMPPKASPGASTGPRPPSPAPCDGSKKNSSIVSTLGLKKLFSSLGRTPPPKLGKSRSCSVEQLQPAAPGPASHTSTSKVRRTPSLQSLHLVSPSRQHRKAASFQNLHSLLSGRGDRSSLYVVEGPGDPSVSGRPATAPPRRALSVEDVGAPRLARIVGRVVEAFPDGTSQLQLQRSSEGTFGFRVGPGNGRRDSGLYVQEMADLDTAKLYSGLLGVGDEILEVNGAKVAGLGLAHIRELLDHSEVLSVRVLRQRPVPR
ncbi:uncharacterized protein KIAA1614 homolog [Ctenodactylus gundi]